MKTLHASVALNEGVKLLFCINPLVPFDARIAVAPSAAASRRVARRRRACRRAVADVSAR